MVMEHIGGGRKVICGLNIAQLGDMVDLLQVFWHAVDEGDWGRMERRVESDYQVLMALAAKMSKAGCATLPHGTDPLELVKRLKIAFDKRGKEQAAKAIMELALTLLTDI